MQNPILNIGIRVFLLSGVFFVLINVFGYLINAQTTNNNSQNQDNSSVFKQTQTDIIGNVGVAITTNIGTRFKEREEIPVSIYKEVMDIGYILANKDEAKNKFISENMIIVNEYLNILKTNIRALLSRSNDRGFALNSYIAQLEYRYKNSFETMKTLDMQRQELIGVINKTENSIENIKNELQINFSTFNANSTSQNIDDYLGLKEENIYARTYVVFINRFISYHNILNNYNKKLIDTLVNNKEILIKNTHVVIPNSGTDVLRELELIKISSDF